MKLLIIGATGMLGHKLALKLSRKHEVYATVRGEEIPVFFKNVTVPSLEIIGGVNAFSLETVENAIMHVRPDYVLNCVGIVKQLKEASDPVISIVINALFPNQLQNLSVKHGFRLIHFSTDCVFSGKLGPYQQSAPSDVNDLYGMTKFLGEVSGPNSLTIRSSIIGRELSNPTGLVEWFLSHRGGAVKGFRHALYTGLTTNEAADLVDFIITTHPYLSGLYQVASQEISKYDLLKLINDVYETGTKIETDTDFHCDRRLAGGAFRDATGWSAKSWEEMIKTMFEEDKLYYITSP